MTQNYNENMNKLVDSYVNKKSLCMLLLASSILFYNMAKSNKVIIPSEYALIISILLILYSASIGIYSGYEFTYKINDIITECQDNKCSDNINHIKNVRNFYTYMGIMYSLLLLFIAYTLIRFDKK
jgi:hypothetical protein